MSNNTDQHTSNDKHEISKQYDKAYTAIIALDGDYEKTESIIRFMEELERHHVDSINTVSRIQTALTLDMHYSAHWHKEMSAIEL